MAIVRYRFAFEDLSETTIAVDLDRKDHNPRAAAEWTKLESHQCSNCPLSKDEYAHCPVALDVAQIVDTFSGSLSYKRAHVRVEMQARIVEKDCDLQTALAALMGLVMASSECPHFLPMRPMAIHHLPFATRDETTMRAVGYYLVEQYIKQSRGEEADFELKGLRETYASLQQVNTDFTERLRAASNADANLNAIVNLFSLAVLVSMSLDNQLDYLEEDIFA